MKICLGITGSIAAFRSPELLKELVKLGHEVSPVLTESARHFVTPKTLETFSGRRVLESSVFGVGHEGTDHIALSRWADRLIVYGATAHFLAKMAAGLGDDFLSLQILAFRGEVIVAPAMNPTMWQHASVQANVALLKSRGVRFVGPTAGVVACGESGIGHVADNSSIIAALEDFATPVAPYAAKKVLVSLGPMQSALDPVRFMQNRSSGRMGLEIAKELKRMGAEPTLLLGPVSSEIESEASHFKSRRYRDPREYRAGLAELFPHCDLFFSLAAVLDFEIEPRTQKLERQTLASMSSLNLQIRAVPDLVAEVAAQKKSHQRVVAFAAEGGSEAQILERALEKLNRKRVDAIVANPLWDGLGPEANQNRFWLLRPGQAMKAWGPLPKKDLAKPLLEELRSLY